MFRLIRPAFLAGTATAIFVGLGSGPSVYASSASASPARIDGKKTKDSKKKKRDDKKVEKKAEKKKAKKSDKVAQSTTIDSLKEGDFFYPKAAFIFEPGESKKPFENSSFDSQMKMAASGRCEVEIVLGSKDSRRALSKVQKISEIKTEEDTPTNTIETFLKSIRAPTLELFEKAVVVDEVEGIGFRSDDLKVRIPEIMEQEPWIQVPQKVKERVSQSLFTHIWAYWGDISKFKRKDYSVLENAKQKYLPIYSEKIFRDIEGYLKSSQKQGKFVSDQMTNYRVLLQVGSPLVAKVNCQLEGAGKDFSLERLNRMMTPYYEVIPKSAFKVLDLENNLPPKTVLPSGVEGL